jgi:hypothetical protein
MPGETSVFPSSCGFLTDAARLHREPSARAASDRLPPARAARPVPYGFLIRMFRNWTREPGWWFWRPMWPFDGRLPSPV